MRVKILGATQPVSYYNNNVVWSRPLGTTRGRGQLRGELTKEDQAALKEAAKTAANLIIGDKCKRNCDLKYPFNRSKRENCKKECVVSSGSSYKGYSPDNPPPSATPAPTPAPSVTTPSAMSTPPPASSPAKKSIASAAIPIGLIALLLR